MITCVLDLIKVHEGCRLTAYLDGENVPTIGYGHTTGVKLGDTCTQNQADLWLLDDLNVAMEDAKSCFSVAAWSACNPPRHAALIDQCFNLGKSRFQKFVREIAAVERQDWLTASAEMRGSRWSQQVRRRAEEDAGMMATGLWPGEIPASAFSQETS